MWSYSENIWPNAPRNWPNARALDELSSHLVTVGRIDQMRSAFGQTRCAIGQMRAHLVNCARVWPNARAIYQTLRIWSNAARLTNWSNAMRIWPNAQIGQMRLTFALAIQTAEWLSFRPLADIAHWHHCGVDLCEFISCRVSSIHLADEANYREYCGAIPVGGIIVSQSSSRTVKPGFHYPSW